MPPEWPFTRHRLHIDATPGLSIRQLRAKCVRLHAQQPLSLVLVDYTQLMRGGEKRPLLSDLRKFGRLEQDANCVVFLWRGEYYNIAEYEDGTATADTVLFDIAKHRNGATDEVIAACNMRRGTFKDLEPANSTFSLINHKA